MENLFLPSHPELIESLLSHLLPRHAIQVGKFFQRLSNSSLLEMSRNLETYLDSRTNQLEAIYNLLNQLALEDETSMTEIKRRFLVVLNGNKLITSWFLQLFPNQNSDESGEENESDNIEFNQSWTETRSWFPAYLVNPQKNRRRESAQESHSGLECAEMASSSQEESTLDEFQTTPNKKPRLEDIPSSTTKWNRDEDRTILEMINGLESCSEETILKDLIEKLPAKTEEDVRQRLSIIIQKVNYLKRI